MRKIYSPQIITLIVLFSINLFAQESIDKAKMDKFLQQIGRIDGFVSNLAYFSEEKVALSILANGMNYNFNDLLIGVFSIYFNVRAIELPVDELEKYEGKFASQQLSLKITLSVKDKQLFGQAIGQSAFPLTPFSKREFRFDPAGIRIVFSTDDKGQVQYSTFTLNQAGGKFTFEEQP